MGKFFYNLDISYKDFFQILEDIQYTDRKKLFNEIFSFINNFLKNEDVSGFDKFINEIPILIFRPYVHIAILTLSLSFKDVSTNRSIYFERVRSSFVEQGVGDHQELLIGLG